MPQHQQQKVVIRWTMRATHQGELMGIAPTGKPVTVTGIDIFRLSAGKLAEMWQNWDQLGMLQQVGALPAPPMSLHSS
jgi:predicted ester cyclase